VHATQDAGAIEPTSGSSGAGEDQMTSSGLTTLEAQATIARAVVDYDPNKRAVVLAEDKQYYPSSEEIYGPEVEVLVQEEDTQPLDQPIIAPPRKYNFLLTERHIPETSFSMKFMTGLMDHPQFIRHVAVVGHLHHGKTSLLDVLVKATHNRTRSNVLGSEASVDAVQAARDRKNLKLDREERLEKSGLVKKQRRIGDSDLLREDAATSTNLRYTDSRRDEQQRGISIKAKPISFVLPDLKGKSHLINFMDTPGHPAFSGEVTAALRLCDGALICVDPTEGIVLHTERLIAHIISENVTPILCLTKIDRLILEMRLPPKDTYLKLRHVVDEANRIMTELGVPESQLFSPERGNVLFCSAEHRWIFSVPSFADSYAQHYGSFPADKFVKRLWGNIYLHEDRSFSTKPERPNHPRTFEQFILTPLYKIYAHTLGADGEQIEGLCEEIGVPISKEELKLNVKPLLRLILGRFFEFSVPVLTSTLLTHVPSPIAAARRKVEGCYTGDVTTPVGRGMLTCDPKAPVMLHLCKSYVRPDLTEFDSFGRVMSGTVRVGDKLRVMGPKFVLDQDEEDMCVLEVTKIWIYQAGRYRVEVNRVTAGNWALFEGLDRGVVKVATATSLDRGDPRATIFAPLKFINEPVVKVAIEPLVPAELPKMLEGLRKLIKCYPLAKTHVEESGEHTLLGAGELDLECMLQDLREAYAQAEIRVSDPCVRFRETVSETSALPCRATTQNKANQITMIAQPLDPKIADDVETGLFTPFSLASIIRARVQTNDYQAQHAEAKDSSLYTVDDEERRVCTTGVVRPEVAQTEISQLFRTRYQWDALASRSIWAFGPDQDDLAANILCDDTLVSSAEKKTIQSIRDYVAEGFDWAMRQGPLCEEPARGIHVRLTDCKLSEDPRMRSRLQFLATARRTCYASVLLAQPRLLEPVYLVEVQMPPDAVDLVAQCVQQRRGHIISVSPRPGSPLSVMYAQIPVIESFGFETDVRAKTFGVAFPTAHFDHWEIVPGDPLDKSIQLKPLQISPTPHLAREFMLKTRRRKGLPEDVNASRYFDEDMLQELARSTQQEEE